ncbi:TPA: hypothetical protein HA239_02125 [Candidatus Woesearchaeota archaeon]|nr:hypothetical protein QT06_C0001G1028 [archaeon GW2011_AR15]MBS3104499.1 hypothetical protein [Candidatus Woesearchaeota archaeon]HIH41187.1 hypothetical protein [Candidatus Woesearchaeota archaeon]
MTEIYSTVVAEQLTYEGLFSVRELVRIIDKYFRTKAFDKKIVFDEEYQTAKGKYFHLKTEYYKKTDSYIRLQTRLWIYVNEYKETEIEVDGNKVKTGHGRLSITFDAFLQTEYFGLFPDTKPFYFLFKVIYEKYLARARIAYWDNVSKHVINELKTELSSYLNLNRFLYEK